MAHFAKLDENNLVIQVVVVGNDDLMVDGVESEQRGIEFCQALFGGNWKQTSYSGTFRKNYAGAGYQYDPIRDAFIPPKHYPSWVLNEQTCQWEPPIPHPTIPPAAGKVYTWDEPTVSWVEVDELPT